MRSTTAFNLLPGSVYLRNMTDNSVGENQYIAGSVNQAALKTTTDTKSTSTTGVVVTLAGGEYGFYLQIKSDATTQHHVTSFIQPNTAASTYTAFTTTITNSYLTRLYHGVSGGNTIYAQQRYIQACPPYNHGPLFIFGMVDNGTGNIESLSISPDPPWANNGPTNIRPDFYKDGKEYKRIKKAKKNAGKLILPIEYEKAEQEITMDYKDSDMELIPHPFQGNDLTGKTIVIVEPGSDLCCELYELHETGENINELIHDGYIVIDNQPLTMSAPKECMPVKAKWKLTK